MTKLQIKAAELSGEHIGLIILFSIPTDRSLTAKRAPVGGQLTSVSHDRTHTYVVLDGIAPATQYVQQSTFGGSQFVLDHTDIVSVDAFVAFVEATGR